jgi:hypothetical protein
MMVEVFLSLLLSLTALSSLEKKGLNSENSCMKALACIVIETCANKHASLCHF